MSINTSRHQFEGIRDPNRITYKRKGGFFISKSKCTGLFLLSTLVAAAVGTLVYVLAPKCQNNEVMNTEELKDLKSIQASHLIRLKRDIIPEYYSIYFKPSIDTNTYAGKVKITIVSNKKTKHIILHSQELNISAVKLYEHTEQSHIRITRATGAIEEQKLDDSQRTGNISTNENITISNKNEDTANLTPVNETKAIETTRSSDKIETNSTSIILEKQDFGNNLTTATEEKNKETEQLKISDNVSENKTNLLPSVPNSTNGSIPNEMNTERNQTLINELKSKIIDQIPHAPKRTITEAAGAVLNVVRFEVEKETSMLKIELENSILKNKKYTLEIDFNSQIRDDFNGIFKVQSEPDHQTLISNHIERTGARKVFPCFDEPNMKSKFKISMEHSTNYKAISNMPVESSEQVNEKTNLTKFKESASMPIYLLTAAITDYDSLNNSYKTIHDNEKPIRFFARKSVLSNTKHALEVLPKVLRFFEEFLGVEFAWEKLDMIAISDLSFNSKGSWGLVSCAEESCLLNETNKSTLEQLSVEMAVTEKMSHHWFRDVVDLWLKRGLAIYMQYLAIDKISPEFKVMNQFNRMRQAVILKDSYESSSPLSQDKTDEAMLENDDMYYMKGAVVIKMLVDTLGYNETSVKIKHFLEKNNTDMWDSFGNIVNDAKETPNISIKDFIDAWTRQPNYPIISVTTNLNDGTVSFTQKSFRIPIKSSSNKWIIPISYRKVSNAGVIGSTIETVWMNDTSLNINVKLKEGETVHVNPDGTGYYRTIYDDRSWQIITSTSPSGYDISDALNTARVNLTPYKRALHMLAQLNTSSSDDLTLLRHEINFLQDLLSGSIYYQYFQKLLHNIIESGLIKYDYGKTVPSAKNKIDIIVDLLDWESVTESERYNEWALSLFKSWMTNPSENSIPQEYLTLVYRTAVKYGGLKETDFLLKILNGTSDPKHKRTILSSLGSVRDESVAYTLLDRSVQSMNLNDAISVWNGCESKVCVLVGQRYVIDNWKRLPNKYDGEIKKRLVELAFGNIVADYEYGWLNKFVKENKEDLATMADSIVRMDENAKINLDWKSKYLEEVGNLLKQLASGTFEMVEAREIESNNPSIAENKTEELKQELSKVDTNITTLDSSGANSNATSVESSSGNTNGTNAGTSNVTSNITSVVSDNGSEPATKQEVVSNDGAKNTTAVVDAKERNAIKAEAVKPANKTITEEKTAEEKSKASENKDDIKPAS